MFAMNRIVTACVQAPETPGRTASIRGLMGVALLLLTLPLDAMKPTDPAHPTLRLATFGGGCFWCLEAAYDRYRGVQSVVSGYAGGTTPNPTYQQVCSGATGHAEVVQITFDPAIITYDQLLDIFWEIHDPTTLNRQGADRGTQYRSIILFHDAEQQEAAVRSRERISRRFQDPVVTEIVPLQVFYRAEAEHQNFYRRNPKYPYCVAVIDPKLKQLEKRIPAAETAPAPAD
jgi:peptide-methionine (S)-S-oxide reductase